jgi:hypothetical protein
MTRQKLNAGTKISYLSYVAEVVEDKGSQVVVICDGVQQVWEWEMCGIRCQVVGKA